MSLSEEPARKLFVKKITNLIPINNAQRHRKWSLYRSKSITVGLVWIQGFAIEVSDIITLDDGTGVAEITCIKDAPGFGSWIKKGQYMMVIGELFSNEPDIKIRAVKLTQLLEPNDEILWILEVLDFWKFIDQSWSSNISTRMTNTSTLGYRPERRYAS